METNHKILLVDDDSDVLEMYQDVLSQLPCKPEVHTAASGARAIALLESEAYRLLITDLKMPQMDGLQVLSIVRRKFPKLRTVVLTSVMDEQFRSRVYALGVDLFWQKPATDREVGMFKDCIESLIEREEQAGFRGVQSKSLVDLIQLECLSQSSSVLRITNGPLHGRIWINHGELFDAEAGNMQAEEAFRHILSWKTGGFEVLAPDPARPRVITASYNALLLESVQALDEARDGIVNAGSGSGTRPAQDPLSKMADLEFFTAATGGGGKKLKARGIESPERIAAWARATLDRFHQLGDALHTGQPETVVGLGPERHVGLTRENGTEFCTGWRTTLDAAAVSTSTKKASALWVS
jgi:CheY-like chemotaxis protein